MKETGNVAMPSSFNIMTLNPKKVLSTGKAAIKDDNNYGLRFAFSFTDKGMSKREYIDSTDSYGCNALFYQIGKVLLKNHPSSELNADSILQSIVYLDFTDIFTTATNKNKSKSKRTATSQIEDGTLSETDLNQAVEKANYAVLLPYLFDSNIGFDVTFEEGKEPKTFVPFDKSGSMSRTCRISFIDKSIKEELDKRLLLDLDFRSISVILSKFYAYRGLYLTDAKRIETTYSGNEGIVLNQDTVIVIKDDSHDVTVKGADGRKTQISIFGGTLSSNGNSTESDVTSKYWKLGETSCDSVKINPFDGEGLICPAYAALLNAQLGRNGYSGKIDPKTGKYDNAASSYQIRMPFTKGVLHTVDYCAFFVEYIGECEHLYIRDFYGIKRDIRKAKIILTESMFKCCKWLQQIWNGMSKTEKAKRNNDPMKYFFDKMKDYDHSLYVGNTDLVIATSERTKMNYQFLNTLKMTGTEFQSVVESHAAQIESLEDKLISDWESQNDLDMSGETLMNTSQPWIGALAKNRAFKKNPKIKSLIAAAKDTMIRDCGRGRLYVSGECRFLSCDLLSLLVFIGMHLIEIPDEKKEKIAVLRHTDCLYADRFYMPSARIELKAQSYCALFRNPHLSRNEQCALRPFIAKKDSMYDKYFSHLSGVIMVSRNSLVPMILSGADFDGDLVKIINDRIIVNAVLDGTYEEGKDKIGRTCYSRKLAIVQIPSTKADAEFDTGCIPYKTVKNTFSNQIGQISNLAIKLGKIEYNSDFLPKVPIESILRQIVTNKCAACTIVTGLEIDAAKTGVHPSANIQELLDVGKQIPGDHEYYAEEEKIAKALSTIRSDSASKDYFLNSEDQISQLPRNRKINFIAPKRDGGDYSVKVASEYKPRFSIHQYDDDDNSVANLDRLPGYYCRLAQLNEKSADMTGSGKTTAAKSNKLFSFQLAGNAWKKALNPQTKMQIEALIKAYLDVLKHAREINRCRKKYSASNYLNCLLNILNMQYVSFDESLPVLLQCSGDSLTDSTETSKTPNPRMILDEVYAALDEYFSEAASDNMQAEGTGIELAGDDNQETNPERNIDIVRVQQAIERLTNVAYPWHLTPREDRAMRLYEIICGADISGLNLSENAIKLLCNFSNSGCYLLYFLLNDILSSNAQRIAPEKYDEIAKARTMKQNYLNGETANVEITEEFRNHYKDYYDWLYKRYCEEDERHASSTLWQKELARMCAEEVKHLSGLNLTKALQYVFDCRSTDKNYTFFWDVLSQLPGNVILNNVYDRSNGEGNSHVG